VQHLLPPFKVTFSLQTFQRITFASDLKPMLPSDFLYYLLFCFVVFAALEVGKKKKRN